MTSRSSPSNDGRGSSEQKTPQQVRKARSYVSDFGLLTKRYDSFQKMFNLWSAQAPPAILVSGREMKVTAGVIPTDQKPITEENYSRNHLLRNHLSTRKRSDIKRDYTRSSVRRRVNDCNSIFHCEPVKNTRHRPGFEDDNRKSPRLR